MGRQGQGTFKRHNRLRQSMGIGSPIILHRGDKKHHMGANSLKLLHDIQVQQMAQNDASMSTLPQNSRRCLPHHV